MKPLSSFNIKNDEWFVYKSKICSVVCSLEYSEFTELNNRIKELTQSYLNQWQFVISAYNKLYNLFSELNSKSNDSENIFSDYVLYSVVKEDEFRDYSYLLILSMKTFLDLFTCLVDITITHEIKPEGKMPSFHSFATSKKFPNHQIINEFCKFLGAKDYSWIELLNESRNRLMHRGYHLKPIFHFTKDDELTMLIYKGADMYIDTLEIRIGDLFDNFMYGMGKMENIISNILLSSLEESGIFQKIEVIYKFGGGITEFSYSEI